MGSLSRGRKRFFDVDELELLAVSSLENIGPLSWRKLYQSFPSLSAVLRSTPDRLKAAGLTDRQATALKERRLDRDSEAKILEARSIKLITIEDEEYPVLLRHIYDPPMILYWQGAAAWQRPCLTVVGTRKPSAYALMALKEILPEELVSQVTLVSGLAFGVDRAVAERSLEFNSPTIAVLACGLDKVYPSAHHQLAEKILRSGGAILSEYPPLRRPRPEYFPVRNRIIAGLSAGCVIVEAAVKSGTLTTAKAALDYNREAFAIPGDITRGSAEGGNFLIKCGATLLDNPQQLFEFLNLTAKAPAAKIDKRRDKLLSLLDGEALSAEQIAEATQEPIEKVLGRLTELELMGEVFQPRVGYYQSK